MTPAAIPAPYLARAKWVRVTPDDLPAAELRRRVTQAYAIVRAGLTKKSRRACPRSLAKPPVSVFSRTDLPP